MAAPPPQALHLLDLHEDEKRLFADVHESTFITTLVDYEPAKQLANSAVDNYMENVSVERPFSVSWALAESARHMTPKFTQGDQSACLKKEIRHGIRAIG